MSAISNEIGDVVWPIFQEIKKHFPDASRRITGSHFTNKLIAPIHDIVHDVDVKIVVDAKGEDRYNCFEKVEKLIRPLLERISKYYEVKQTPYTHTPTISYGLFTVKKDKKLPIEISINVVDSLEKVHLHVMNVDAYYAEESEEAGSFLMRSEEGDLEDIRNKVITSIASDQLLPQLNTAHWSRYIIALTDGFIEPKTTNTNFYFFQKFFGLSSGLSELIKVVNRKRKEIPEYRYAGAFNAFLNAEALVSSSKEIDAKSSFIRSFKTLIKGSEKKWVAFFESLFKRPIQDDDLAVLIKLFLPFFADGIELKKHLTKVQAQVKLQEGDHLLHILVPILSEEESKERATLSRKEDVAFPLEGTSCFLPLIRESFLGNVSKEQISKEKAIESKVQDKIKSGDLIGASKELLKSDLLNPLEKMALIRLCKTELSEEQCHALLLQLLQRSKDKGEPLVFSKEMTDLLERAQRAKPWEVLFLRYVQETPLGEEGEKEEFFKVFSQKVGDLALDRFPKLLPDENKKWIYRLKLACFLKSSDPEKSFDQLFLILGSPNLSESVSELRSYWSEVNDPFNFESTWNQLSKLKASEKKLRLLAYQGVLKGFSSILSLYFNEIPQRNGEHLNVLFLSVLKICLDEMALDAASRVKRAWGFYKYAHENQAVLDFIEEGYLSTSNAEVLVSNLSEEDRKKYASIVEERIKNVPQERIQILFAFLALLGKSDLLKVALKRPESIFEIANKYPDLIEDFLKKLVVQKDKKAVHHTGSQLAEQGHEVARQVGLKYFTAQVAGLLKNPKDELLNWAKSYLFSASSEERSQFAFTLLGLSLAFNPVIKDLFDLAIPLDFNFKEGFQSLPWNSTQVQNGFHLMKDKRSPEQVEGFLESVIESISHVKENRTLLRDLSSCFNEKAREFFARRAQEELKRMNSSELSSYMIFLREPVFTSIVLENEPLYRAYTESLLKEDLSKISKKEADSALNFLMTPVSFSTPVSAIDVALAHVKKAGKIEHARAISWFAERLLSYKNSPEFSILFNKIEKASDESIPLFLEKLLPELDSEKDEEEVLNVLSKSLPSLCDVSLIKGFANYVLSMSLRFPNSKALIPCSKLLVEIASKAKEMGVIKHLLENIHVPHLESAIKSTSDKDVFDELVFWWNPSVVDFIGPHIKKCANYAKSRLEKDPSFLYSFLENERALPKVSRLFCHMFSGYIKFRLGKSNEEKGSANIKMAVLDHLISHLQNLKDFPLEDTDFNHLVRIADVLIHKSESMSSIKEEKEVIGFLAGSSLELMHLLMRSKKPERLKKAEELFKKVHLERFSSESDEVFLFEDLEACYALLKRHYKNNAEEIEGIPLQKIERGLIKYLSSLELDSLDQDVLAPIASLQETMIQACRRVAPNSESFALSMLILKLCFHEVSLGIPIEPELINQLFKIGLKSSWKGFDFYSYVSSFVNASRFAVAKNLMTNEMLKLILEKSIESIKEIKEIKEENEEDLKKIVHIARIACDSCPKYCKKAVFQIPKSLFSSLYQEMKRLAPTKVFEILTGLTIMFPLLAKDYKLVSVDLSNEALENAKAEK